MDGSSEFWDNFAVDFSGLCSALRLAATCLPPPRPSNRDEIDAHNLLGLVLIGLEALESKLEEKGTAR